MTAPYKKSSLSQTVKNDCEFVNLALNNLQKIVVKLRGFTAVRESLGTALHVPVITRWTTNLEMVDCALKSKVNILETVQDKKPELVAIVEKLYSEYESVFEDYRKLMIPIKKIITQLEVSLYSSKVIHSFLGRQICDYLSLSSVVCVVEPLFGSRQRTFYFDKHSQEHDIIRRGSAQQEDGKMERKVDLLCCLFGSSNAYSS